MHITTTTEACKTELPRPSRKSKQGGIYGQKPLQVRRSKVATFYNMYGFALDSGIHSSSYSRYFIWLLRFLIQDGLKVYAYVILENHLHMVVQSEQLERDVGRFKSYTAKQLIRYLDEHKVTQILEQLAFYKKAHKADRAYQFWQEGCHPEWIQNDEMMRQKLDYIHQNPVKRGYVDKAEHWRYSSARDYLGVKGQLLHGE